MLEFLGDTDAALLAYQHVMTLGLKDKPTSNSLCSLGHMWHVRGEYGRALSLYRRSILTWKNNPLALIMRGCLGATVLSLPIGERIALQADAHGSTETPDTADQVCALFRRGLVFLKGGSRWIGLLCYGEVTAYILKDLARAETLLWDSVKLSMGRTAWATVALIHFYQYARNDYERAHDVYETSKLLRFTKAKVDSATVDDYVAIQVVLCHLRMEVGDMDGAHDAAIQVCICTTMKQIVN
jgi:tetratricopeptide (TPR) repeat protein